MEILRLDHVAKNFGALSVITDLSFSVGEGRIFGLIGKNGTGKTTTMKMILGLLKQTGGEIFICGEKVVYGSARTNRYVGYLPDVPEFYGFMRPREYLKLCGEISGLSSAWIKDKSDELLTLVGLQGINRKIGGFSRGMKQRLGIAQALLSEPKLLICDEPTSALDPVGRKEILDILSVASRQTSIVFSTHILSDVERICDEIGILDNGKLVLSSKLSDVKNTYRSDSVLIEPVESGSIPSLTDTLLKSPSVRSAEVVGRSIVVRLARTAADSRPVLALLVRENVPIQRFEVREPSLEDVFLEVTK